MGICLELLGTAEYRASSGLIAQEDADQPVGNFTSDLEQVQQVARAGGALDLKFVTEIQVVLEQGADQQNIDRHPDRSAPVRVSAKHPGVRFRRKVMHPMFLA